MQNEKTDSLVQVAEKKLFPLVSMVFFQTYYGFFICYLISLSPGHGVTCRANMTLIQCGYVTRCVRCAYSPSYMGRMVARCDWVGARERPAQSPFRGRRSQNPKWGTHNDGLLTLSYSLLWARPREVRGGVCPRTGPDSPLLQSAGAGRGMKAESSSISAILTRPAQAWPDWRPTAQPRLSWLTRSYDLEHWGSRRAGHTDGSRGATGLKSHAGFGWTPSAIVVDHADSDFCRPGTPWDKKRTLK